MRSAISTIIMIGLALSQALGQDLDRGIEEFRKSNHSEAESLLRKAVDQQGEDARAHAYLALALAEQEKVSDAEPHAKKAEELDASIGKVALARIYIQQKKFDEAEAALKEAGTDELQYVRGLLNFHRSRHQESADDLEAYLSKYPEHAYAHYYAGLAYNGLKRPDKMLTHFEIFLKLKPDAPEARKVRSVLRSVR
jgi:tetratricopeptide (TPR) repeat protein